MRDPRRLDQANPRAPRFTVGGVDTARLPSRAVLAARVRRSGRAAHRSSPARRRRSGHGVRLLGVADGVVLVPVLTSRRVGMARAEATGTTIAGGTADLRGGGGDVREASAMLTAGRHRQSFWGPPRAWLPGSLLASRARAPVLRGLFNLVLLATAVRLLVALPEGSVRQIAVAVPEALTLCALGTVAGLASGMLGSGGGFWIRARAAGRSGDGAARLDPDLGHRGADAPQDAHAQAQGGRRRGRCGALHRCPPAPRSHRASAPCRCA